jgi:hypothetical protein
MNKYLEIDLTEQSNRTIQILFDHIIRYIYKLAQIRFIKYNSKLYFQMTNKWNGGIPKNISQEEKELLGHEDCSCDGYWDDECKLLNKKWKKTNPSSSELEYIYNYDEGALKVVCQDIHKSIKIPLKKIHNFIFDLKSNPETQVSSIKFLVSKPLIITNPNGINTDHRGSNHTKLILPFVSNVTLGEKFTFKDLINTMYQIKSHKFDYWYEFYCAVIISSKKNSPDIKINVSYDHGS